MDIRAIPSLSFSSEFIRKTGGGCTEKLLELVDTIFSISDQNILFEDISKDNKILIIERFTPISNLELTVKFIIGILLLPLTILAIAIKVILRCIFYAKIRSFEVRAITPDLIT